MKSVIKRIPFNIKKAKAGAKVVTRDGYPVRIGFFELKGKHSFPIVGAIDKDGKEDVRFFTAEGKFSSIFDEDGYDLFIEEKEEVEETDDPYKEVVKSISDMVERYADSGSDLQDFYDNVKAKCREAVEYDKKWCKKQEEQKTKIIIPKFRVGDLIVQDNVGIYKVTEICESWYEVIDSDGSNYSISFDKEPMCHLWTIQDAKLGDILASKNGENILIFRQIISGTGFSSYYNTREAPNVGWSNDFFIAATKEQSALLFQKIKEAGYEWDSYKMELKRIENEDVAKIEFNSKFKIGDKVTLKSNKLSTGIIMQISDNGMCYVRFPDLSMYWYTEDMLEPYEMIEDDDNVEPRLMTNLELSDWLRKCPEERREFKYKGCNCVFASYEYIEKNANRPVEDKLIRRNHGEWQEPLIEE